MGIMSTELIGNMMSIKVLIFEHDQYSKLVSLKLFESDLTTWREIKRKILTIYLK